MRLITPNCKWSYIEEENDGFYPVFIIAIFSSGPIMPISDISTTIAELSVRLICVVGCDGASENAAQAGLRGWSQHHRVVNQLLSSLWLTGWDFRTTGKISGCGGWRIRKPAKCRGRRNRMKLVYAGFVYFVVRTRGDMVFVHTIWLLSFFAFYLDLRKLRSEYNRKLMFIKNFSYIFWQKRQMWERNQFYPVNSPFRLHIGFMSFNFFLAHCSLKCSVNEGENFSTKNFLLMWIVSGKNW